MKINNKISLIVVCSILLIANAILIGRYLDEKQKINNTFNAAVVSKEINKNSISHMEVVRQQNIGKSVIPSTSFSDIGPTTNLKIKVTGSGKRWGISKMSYFLKYQTWEKKSIIQSNGTVATMWNAVNHEITVGGDDSKTIEVAGIKIAETEVRIKSSHATWKEMTANKDLKWPKGLNPTIANTTYSIDSTGDDFNPSVSFYYHIKGYDNLKVGEYDIFSFLQWCHDHWAVLITDIISACIFILCAIAAVVSFGMAASPSLIVFSILSCCVSGAVVAMSTHDLDKTDKTSAVYLALAVFLDENNDTYSNISMLLATI